MAEVLSGSINTNKYTTSSHGTLGLNLSWTATQSIANNTSTIKWTLKSNGSMSSGYYVKSGPVTVVIAGKTVLHTTSRFDMKGGGAYKKTGTLTVSHGTDGKKSISVSVKAAIYKTSVNCTASASYTLKTIPRYASITSVTNFNDTGFPTIVYENLAGSSVVTDLKARLMWTVNGTDYYTPFVNLNVGGGTYTFNSTSLPQSEKNRMLSACALSNTLAFKVDLQSSLNGTLGHNYKEATMTVVNANPIAPSTPLSYREANDTIYNNITHDRLIIVQNQSTLEITINDYTGAKYAAIFDYTLKFNGVSYTIFSSDPNRKITITKPNINGTFAAQLTVTDSRLNKSTASINIPIKAWSAPTADRRIARKNSFEDDTIINVTGHISSIKNSQQEELNTMTIQERHQQKGTSNWSSWITLTSGQDRTVILDNSYEWNVQITVTDKFTTTTYNSVVGTGKPLMIYDIKRKSVGINGIPDADNQLFVDGQIKCSSMYVKDISNQYSLSKTSGAWNATEIKAYRSGNVVYMRIRLQGTNSAVNAGSNGFVGTLSGGPLPMYEMSGINFAGSSGIISKIQQNGTVTARVIGSNLTIDDQNATIVAVTFLTSN